jgi:NTP pyrophosphatase (non-canonical NTP hydrolase)
MNIEQYQIEVARTCATSDPAETIKLALVGVIGEFGEVADPLKKVLWGGHVLDEATMIHLQEEIGDVCWYLATLCNALGISLDETLRRNIEKLYRRYPDGFSPERSLCRSVE